jgi:hypothetical protein
MEDKTRRTEQRDVFISYASEDRSVIASPLAAELVQRGHTVWFDEYELVLGDSLRTRIDEGLADSTIGVVILSHHFFAKPWPRRELDGFNARLMGGERNVLVPIWHELTEGDLLRYSPPLASLLAGNSTEGVRMLAQRIERVLARRSTYRVENAIARTVVQQPSSRAGAAGAEPPTRHTTKSRVGKHEEPWAATIAARQAVRVGVFRKCLRRRVGRGAAAGVRSRRTRAGLWGAAGTTACVVAFVAIGWPGHAHASTFRSGHLVLSLDGGWRREGSGTSGVPKLRSPIAIANGQTRIRAGALPSPGRIATELPATFKATYGAPSQSSVVSLRAGQGRRYVWSDPHRGRPVMLVLIATRDGEVAISCSASGASTSSRLLSACSQVWRGAQIAGTTVEYPGADPRVVARLRYALAPREDVASDIDKALRSSRLPLRAHPLEWLASVDRTTATALAVITSSPRYQTRLDALVGALRHEADVGAMVSQVARSDNRAKYDHLRRQYLTADRRVVVHGRELFAVGLVGASVTRIDLPSPPPAHETSGAVDHTPTAPTTSSDNTKRSTVESTTSPTPKRSLRPRSDGTVTPERVVSTEAK